MKVALIDEAEVGRDRGNLLSLREAALRFFETQMAKIAVHWHAVSTLESPTELKSAHRRDRCQLAHRHRALKAVVQMVANPAQGKIVVGRRRPDLDDPFGQGTETSNQQLIGGQRRGRCRQRVPSSIQEIECNAIRNERTRRTTVQGTGRTLEKGI